MKQFALKSAGELSKSLKISPSSLAKQGIAINQDGVLRSALDLLAYPDFDWVRISRLWPELAKVPAEPDPGIIYARKEAPELEEREKAEEEVASLLELAERRQKVEVIDRGLADMARRRSQLAEILVQRKQEIDGWTRQIEELATESTRENERAAQLAGTLVGAQQTVEKVRAELAEVEVEAGLRRAADTACTAAGCHGSPPAS